MGEFQFRDDFLSVSLPVPRFLFYSVFFLRGEKSFLQSSVSPLIFSLLLIFPGLRDAALRPMALDNVEGHWRELTAVLECCLFGRKFEHWDALLQLPLHPGPFLVIQRMPGCIKWGCQFMPGPVKWHVKLEPLNKGCERPATWGKLWKYSNLKYPCITKLMYSAPLADPQNLGMDILKHTISQIIHQIAAQSLLLSFFLPLFHLFT